MIATARDDASKLEALGKTASNNLRIERVDISDTDGIAALGESLVGEKLDLLFLIAGISGSVPKPLHEVTADEAARVYLINTYHPIVAAQTLATLLRPAGTVAFMSSRLGSIGLNDYGQWETYRLSKAALNMGARSFFRRPSLQCFRSHPAGCAPTWVAHRQPSMSRQAAAMSPMRSSSTARLPAIVS